MANESEGKSKLDPKSLKWIVFGVLGVVFILVFRQEIGQQISGAEKISLGLEGVKIETKTTKTPLGETIVSGPMTLDTAAVTSEAAPSYRSPTGYRINWPDDGDWQAYPDYASAMGLDLFVGYRTSFGDFMPNVNVTIEPTMGMSLADWMAMGNENFVRLGVSVENVQIDPETNSGVRVLRSYLSGVPTHQIQRFYLHGGKAYIATATKLDGLDVDPKLWSDLNRILNSFRVA